MQSDTLYFLEMIKKIDGKINSLGKMHIQENIGCRFEHFENIGVKVYMAYNAWE